MDIDLDTGKLFVFVGGISLFIFIETLFPKRKQQMTSIQRFSFHIVIALFNTVVVRTLIYVPFLYWLVYVEQSGWGLSRWLGLSGWTEILCSIIVLDLFDYFWHRFNHRVPFLWRFHKAHHTDNEVDVSTSLRFHPGELMISGIMKATWLAIWGPSVITWFLFEAAVSLCAQFHHSNIDIPDRIENKLAQFLVTPRFHAAHHAVDRRYGDANFSTIFSIWDPLFRTFQRPCEGGATTLGIDKIGLPEGRNLIFSPLSWICEPFSSRNMNLETKS